MRLEDLLDELVAGGRRLEAVRSLGHDTIAATVLPMSPEEMLQAESDENTARLNLRRSEMVEIGRRLEAVLKGRIDANRAVFAKRAVRIREGLEDPGDKTAPRPTGKTRDNLSRALGVSGGTYEKAKQVVEAAEADPDTYGDLVEKMDETNNVYGTHREMVARKNGGLDEVDVVGALRVAREAAHELRRRGHPITPSGIVGMAAVLYGPESGTDAEVRDALVSAGIYGRHA